MKRILFVVHRIPFPPNKGDKIRSFNELKYLAQRHTVDLLCLVDDPKDFQYVLELEKICNRVKAFPLNPQLAKIRGGWALMAGKALSSRYFYCREMQATLDRWVQTHQYDSIVCFSSSMAEYIFCSRELSRLERAGIPRLIMDFCDVDSAKWQQYSDDSKFPLNWVYSREQKLLMEYEQRIQHYFDKTVLATKDEADYFRANFENCEKLTVVPNGVDHGFFSPLSESHDQGSAFFGNTPVVVFTGAMDYPVNINGVLWFVREVWPILQQHFPAINLFVVGSNPANDILELQSASNITVTGFVPDIREYYNLADVCIAPLHLGRGVQNKVLEAMSMGKPVVATSRANKGVCGVVEEHLLVADKAEDFICSICRLLNDPQLAKSIGLAAREFVVSHFDWDSNLLSFEKLLMESG